MRELEFLVLPYDGNTHFTAMVFDTTACERQDLLLGTGPRRGRQSNKRRRWRRARTALSRDDDASAKRDKDYSVGKVPYRAPVKTEIEDGDEVALRLMTPTPPPPSQSTHRGAGRRSPRSRTARKR